MPSFEEYCEEIRPLWDSRWLTNMGEKHNKLQTELEDYLKVSNVSLFTNGHLALESILSCLQLPKGGEVITTPFTFVSTTHAIARCGLSPVFCDVNEYDFTIDVRKIESLICEKTVAILPVHVYGNVCDVYMIDQIAKKKGIRVIYDAAHAFGEQINDKSVVSFGDASMISFHATKVFNTIEGGAVCFSDETLSDALNEIKDFGIHSEEIVSGIGGNAKMSEFQAAMGLCNLRHVDEEIKKRGLVVERYRTNLKNQKGITLCDLQKNVKSNFAYFPVLFDGITFDRNLVKDRLQQQGIGARKYFYPLTNDLACYQNCKGAGHNNTPIAYKLSQRVLTLPLYADLSLKDVDRICDIILDSKTN